MKWKDVDWLTAVERRHTPLFIDFLIKAQSDINIIRRITGYDFRFSNILDNIARDDMRLAYGREQIVVARDQIRAEWHERGTDHFSEFAERCLKSCQRTLDITSTNADRDFSGFSISDLTVLFKEYEETMIDHAAFLQTIILTQFELEDYIDTYLAEHPKSTTWDAGTVRTIREGINLPSEPTHEVQNAVELLRLTAELQTYWPDAENLLAPDLTVSMARFPTRFPELWAGIENYARRFGWMGRMYYDGNPINEYDILLRVQNLLTEDCTAKLKEYEQRHQQKRDMRDQAIAALGGDEDARNFTDMVSIYLHLRTYRLDVFFIANEHVVTMLEEIGKRLGLSYRNLIYLNADEIRRAMSDKGQAKKLRRIAINRTNGYAVAVLDGTVTWYDYPLSDKSPSHDLAPESAHLELTGTTACAGYTKGKVRLVLTDGDILDMQKGEVLVTTMTMPNTMLAVEKASAIVTDEGGMLCHAAIVSRELNIPCVINTQHATKWLENGNTVVVDATKGLVTRE